MTDSAILHPISNRELERRWRLTRVAMEEHRVDALVIQATQDWLGGYLKWFTDLPATNGYPCSVIFPRLDPMTLIEQGPMNGTRAISEDDPLYRGVGRKRYTPSYSSVHYTKYYDAKIVAEELRAQGCRRIGLVATAQMQYDFCDYLSREFGPNCITDFTPHIDDIKAVKSPEEQGFIRRTAALQDQVMSKVATWVQPGIFDFEIAAFAQHCAQDLGSEQGIFLGSSAKLGTPAGFRPRHEKGRRLEAGEHFSLLVEVNGPGGFYTEIGRIFVLGDAPQFLVDGMEAMKEAQQFMLDMLTPGALCSEVFDEFNAYMRRRGLPEEARLNAHGMGYDMVERPLIRSDETMRISAGMSVVVHPGLMTREMFAVVCDNYLIEANGPGRCLHRTPQKIFEI